MSRIALAVLPALAVGFVAFALMVVGVPTPPAVARIYGGPTEGATSIAWRLQASPGLAVRVEARIGDGRHACWDGVLDDEGSGHVTLDFGTRPVTGPLAVRVTAAGITRALIDDRVDLGVADWIRDGKSQGGWLRGQQSGTLSVTVAPARGVVPLGFAEPLLVEVREAGAAVSLAEISIEGDGVDPAPRSGVRTDASGRALVEILAREVVAALKVVARSPSGARGEWAAGIPVLPGSYQVRTDGGRIRISSPVPRDRAYFVVIGERQRIASGRIDLTEGVGSVALPRLPDGPLWVMVSSDLDLRSASTVGWPLMPGLGGPHRSLTVPDRLLADGQPAAAAVVADRKAKSLRISVAFVLTTLLLLGLLIVRRVRHAQARLAEHLERNVGQAAAAMAPSAGRSLWLLAVALLAVGLGFLMLALLLVYSSQ